MKGYHSSRQDRQKLGWMQMGQNQPGSKDERDSRKCCRHGQAAGGVQQAELQQD